MRIENPKSAPSPFPSPRRLCRNQQKTNSVTTRDRRSGDEALGRKPFIAQLWKSKPMKRIPFLRGPITHKFKRPHSKAEEPDCLSLRNPPSTMITTQSPRGERDGVRGGYLANPIRIKPIVRIKAPVIRVFHWLSLRRRIPIAAPKRALTWRKATT